MGRGDVLISVINKKEASVSQMQNVSIENHTYILVWECAQAHLFPIFKFTLGLLHILVSQTWDSVKQTDTQNQNYA